MKSLIFAGLVAVSSTYCAGTAAAQSATAAMHDANGNPIGTVTLRQTPSGVMIRAELSNLTAGGHGFHIHATGKCAPGFKAAGGHYNPAGKAHGLYNSEGHHAGDMPNIFAAQDGSVNAEVLNSAVTLGEGANSVFDADGSAIIIHAKPDSHGKAPGAGARVACGVISH